MGYADVIGWGVLYTIIRSGVEAEKKKNPELLSGFIQVKEKTLSIKL